MPYREDQARRNSRGDAQSSAERRLASAKTEAWVLLTQQQRGAVSAEELRRFDGLPLPGVSSHGADSGHAPLPTRKYSTRRRTPPARTHSRAANL